MAEDFELIKQRAYPMDIISTGVIITYKNDPIEIIFGKQDVQIKLIIAFRDTEDGAKRIEGKSKDQFTLELTLHNFNDTISGYPLQPVHLGILSGHNIYLNFAVQSLKDNKSNMNINKVFNYTIYLDPEVIQGKKE